MTNHKIYRTVTTGFILSTLLILTGCKKLANDPIKVVVSALMPHDSSPVPGVKWKIKESKSIGFSGKTEETDFELSGETDASGISVVTFYPRKNNRYDYHIYFDYSEMNLPTGDYVITSGPTSFAYLYNSVNAYSIRILPKMDVTLHFKNTNCSGSSDSFLYRMFNMDERQNETINDYPWVNAPLFQGCSDETINSSNVPAGHYAFEWEATRNGITESGGDTILVTPGGNNLMNIYW